MLVPRMLAESPGHEGIRMFCAQLVLAFNHSVLQDLMSSAFQCREKLGKDFTRLQYLILVSSGILEVKEITHGGNSFWGCPDIDFDVRDRFDQLISQFVKAETPVALPRLVDVAAESNNTIAAMVRRQHDFSDQEPIAEDVRESITSRIRRGRGFQPLRIRAGFSWLEQIDDDSSRSERAQFIDILENLTQGVLRPLGGISEALFDDDDDNSFFTIPGDWDTWIFDLIARVVPTLEEAESASRLWKPILSFGLDRMH